jgi:hypothetical protein
MLTSNQVVFLSLFIVTTIGSIVAGCILPTALATTVITGLCVIVVIYILFS